MGEVYLAYDQRLKREISLKILPQEYSQDKSRLAWLHREATAAAALNHPNICTIHEVGESEGKTYICMEYVEGKTLREIIRSMPPTVEETVEIGIQIADALEQAREKNIVHRDIKSQNIILTPRGQAKILDFGLAKNLPREGPKPEFAGVTESLPSTEVSSVGMVMGTVSYMSPEQALGLEADHRSDLFSFGVVLYEMLTGKTPFAGETTEEVLPKIVYENAPAIESLRKDVPPDLVRIINKLLAKRKEDRFQTAAEVLTSLQAIRDKVRVPAFAKIERRRISRKILWPALGLALALVVIFFIFFRPGKKALVPSAEAASLTALPAKVYGASEYAYLTDAIPSTLSTCLGQVEGLEVKVPPTSFEVEKVKGDLGIIADLYKASILVVSSVTAESGRFFLNVQLVEAKTRGVRWSRQFEGPAGQYMETVRRAAEDIRQFMKPSALPIVAGKGKSEKSEAELAFQRGKFFLNRYINKRELKDFDTAFEAFKQALELDPKLADAAAEISGLYGLKLEAEGSETQQKAMAEMEFWARKALEINPKCSQGWASLTFLEGWKPKANWKLGLEYALKGVFFGPENAVAHNTLFNTSPSYWLGIPILQEAMRIDPFFLYPALNLSASLNILGRSEEALSVDNKALQIEPDSPDCLTDTTITLIYLNRLQEAAELIKRLERFFEEKRLGPVWHRVVQHAYLIQENNPAKIEPILTEVRETADKMAVSRNELSNYVFFISPLLARHGHKDLVIYLLEKLQDSDLIFNYDYYRLNPDFQKLKGEPRFEKILVRSRARFEEALAIFEDARRRGEFPKYLEKPLEELLIKLEITKK